MAEGLLRHEGGAPFEVHSAGTHPTSVRPEAVAVMSELGIDISRHWSKSVDEFRGQEFDFVITVCDNANAACPHFPGNTRRLHWPFEDPAAVTGTSRRDSPPSATCAIKSEPKSVSSQKQIGRR